MRAGEIPATTVVLLDGDQVLARWPVRVANVDLATVDAIARLHLDARRQNRHVEVRNPCAALVALLDLVGLTELLGADGGDGVDGDGGAGGGVDGTDRRADQAAGSEAGNPNSAKISGPMKWW